VRRVSLEAALVVLAVAALGALRRRGVVSMSGAADLVLAAAPVLVAAAGALLLWRAVPPLLGAALRVARRSRKAAPLLAVARARSTEAVLPFVALVVVTALVALCGALAGTARAGQADGSWDSVGADVVVRTTLPDASLQDVAGELAASDGVDAVAVGRVQARSQLFGVRGVDDVRVLAVDPVEYAALLAQTPFGAVPELRALADASAGATTRAAPGPLPALVPGSLLGTRPSMRWGSVTVDLEPVGQVPALPAQQADGTSAGLTVVVDRAALTAVVRALDAARAEQTASESADTDEAVVDPDTVWAVGPQAPDAARAAAAATVGGNVLARTQWLEDRRSDPLANGLLALVALVRGRVRRARGDRRGAGRGRLRPRARPVAGLRPGAGTAGTRHRTRCCGRAPAADARGRGRRSAARRGAGRRPRGTAGPAAGDWPGHRSVGGAALVGSGPRRPPRGDRGGGRRGRVLRPPPRAVGPGAPGALRSERRPRVAAAVWTSMRTVLP
jgi:putative ABC transport system permease protein